MVPILSLENQNLWNGLLSAGILSHISIIPLKAILPSPDDPILVFEICCFWLTRPHKSFTNHFPGVRMVLIICFQNRLGFNRADFTPVSTLFSMHILPKTSDFPFWNHLFSRSPTWWQFQTTFSWSWNHKNMRNQQISICRVGFKKISWKNFIGARRTKPEKISWFFFQIRHGWAG